MTTATLTVPAHIVRALGSLCYAELYPTPDGAYQVEAYTDARRLAAHVERCGFTVVGKVDDYMDDERYAYVTFKEG